MKDTKEIFLSKSRIMRGLQCPKALHMEIYRPDLKQEVSAAQEAIFEQGHEVGREAQKRFPGGYLVTAPPHKPKEAFAETMGAIANGHNTIFEATFLYENIQVKLDILHRHDPQSDWRLIEVKSSTKLKRVYMTDVAIQTWVCERVGIKLLSKSVMFLNRRCTFPDLEDLFCVEDITKDVDALTPSLPASIFELRRMLQEQEPVIDIGPHCDSPHDCPYISHCREAKKIPSPSVFDLPGLAGEDVWGFYREGIVRLDDPRLLPKPLAAQRAINVFRGGARWIDSDTIRERIAEWRWPLHFLDFETIAFAIPQFAGARPYDQVPFQFSLHLQREPNVELGHREYLHDQGGDPREPLADALVDSVKEDGSIVAYYKSFEAGCLKELAKRFPRHERRLLSMIARLVDPLPIVRSSVYDNAFRGSFSIKDVAPALLGSELSYEGMMVADGQAAQRAFIEMGGLPPNDPRRATIRKAMLDYCKKDTLAMVMLVEWLRRHASTPRQKAG